MYRFLAPFTTLVVLMTGLTVAAEDEKKAAPDKAPDWSRFVVVAKMAGEVTEVSEEGLTIKVKKSAITGRSRRSVKIQTKTQELPLVFAEAGLVRWIKLPTRYDDNGKRQPYTSKERLAAKLPKGTPGYAAERSDLQPGQVVTVTLVRPKSIPASKATFQDLKVKYAIIVADPNAGKKVEKK